MPINIWKPKGERYYRYAYYFKHGERKVTGSTRHRANSWPNAAQNVFGEKLSRSVRDSLLPKLKERPWPCLSPLT